MGRTAMGGLLSPTERRLDINLLEMMAGTFAVQTFSGGRQGIQVHKKMDNTMAVAYVNHLGCTRSTALSKKVRQLWMWCLDWEITISADYLSGKKNITADFQSRVLTSSVGWRLNPARFDFLAKKHSVHAVWTYLQPVSMHLFATRLNAQLGST